MREQVCVSLNVTCNVYYISSDREFLVACEIQLPGAGAEHPWLWKDWKPDVVRA